MKNIWLDSWYKLPYNTLKIYPSVSLALVFKVQQPRDRCAIIVYGSKAENSFGGEIKSILIEQVPKNVLRGNKHVLRCFNKLLAPSPELSWNSCIHLQATTL